MHQAQEVVRLLREHRILLRAYADVQARCSALLREQAERMRRMDAQAMRMRAALVLRTTELAWEREDRAALERSVPGLARRLALGRQVAALQERVRLLARELGRNALSIGPACGGARHAVRADEYVPVAGGEVGPGADLAAHLASADLVICQSGCLGHGDYWRVQDHCRRTGKPCVLVDRPDAVRIVRIHREQDDAAALTGRR